MFRKAFKKHKLCSSWSMYIYDIIHKIYVYIVYNIPFCTFGHLRWRVWVESISRLAFLFCIRAWSCYVCCVSACQWMTADGGDLWHLRLKHVEHENSRRWRETVHGNIQQYPVHSTQMYTAFACLGSVHWNPSLQTYNHIASRLSLSLSQAARMGAHHQQQNLGFLHEAI